MEQKEKFSLKAIKQYRPFIFMMVYLSIFQLTATTKFSDDVIIMTTNQLQDGLFPLILYIYNNWTSRVIICPIMVALCVAPIFIWNILEVIVWIVLAVSISKIVSKEENENTNWFLVGFMILYPYWHMATAGWISTTTNYIWPLAFGVSALLTLKRMREGVKISIFRYMLFIFTLLYASDAEQGVMILLLIFAVLIISLLYIKHISSLQYRITLLCGFSFLIARLVFTLTAPGNHVRLLAGYWQVPEFAEYSLFNRILLGLQLTAMHYTQFTVALFPFFSLFLIIIVWHKHPVAYKRIIAVIPFLISMALSSITAINALQFARKNLSTNTGQFINMFIMTSIPDWAGSNFIFVLFFICLLYTLHLSSSNIKESLFVTGVMALGFLSQLVLGLSPTLYASAFRTFTYASFAIIICATYLYDRGANMYIGKFAKAFFIIGSIANTTITFAISIIRMRF